MADPSRIHSQARSAALPLAARRALVRMQAQAAARHESAVRRALRAAKRASA